MRETLVLAGLPSTALLATLPSCLARRLANGPPPFLAQGAFIQLAARAVVSPLQRLVWEMAWSGEVRLATCRHGGSLSTSGQDFRRLQTIENLGIPAGQMKYLTNKHVTQVSLRPSPVLEAQCMFT